VATVSSLCYATGMNSHTTITPEGNIPIPADIIERLGLKPGMDIVIDEAAGTLRLKPTAGVFAPDLPRATTEQLLAKPRYDGRPATTEEISSLSNEAILRVLLMQEHDARR
jgi:bifunctional DNA-binding transcriptional regulator/antitoxin component of YhaV-PrlF toxin-antitoxin module